MTESSVFACPKCHRSLPETRRQFPWCECGWNLPTDPIEQLKGLPLILEKINRWFGKIQADMDERWLSQKNREANIGWILLTGLMNSLGVAFQLLTIFFFVLLVGIFLFGVIVFPQNCILGLLILGASGAFLYVFWIQKMTKNIREKPNQVDLQERILETAHDVAERLNLASPNVISFSPWPIILAYSFWSWSPLPRMKRGILVGVPLLATLNMTELKTLMGRELYFVNGARAWFLPKIQKALSWLWKAFNQFQYAFLGIVLSYLILGFLYAVMMSIFITDFSTIPRFLGNMINWLLLPLIFISLVFILILFFSAFWFRRESLLADRFVAISFGQNALLEAHTKLLLTRRTFGRQWAGIASDARWNPEIANIYTQFRNAWDGLSDEYKEKSTREVAIGFRAFLYSDPILTDREKFVKDLPNMLIDNRPADTLLPEITKLGAMLSSNLKSIY